MSSASSQKITKSRLGGMHKNNRDQIAESLSDFQLTINGLVLQSRISQSCFIPLQNFQSIARAGSIFLRKLILDKKALFDKTTLDSLNLKLPPLMRVPKSSRRTIETSLPIKEVALHIRRVADGHGSPIYPTPSYVLTGGLQGYRILIEWPLLGMIADKNGTWNLSHDQLFDVTSRRAMSSDQWLGQQVVLCDEKGISLGKILRTVANLHGAHSIVGTDPLGEGKDPHVHIVRNISLFGLGYMELIVLETALYLHKLLLNEPSINKPPGETCIVTPSFTSPSEDTLSAQPNWLQYAGSNTLVFNLDSEIEQHTIRAPITS